MIDIDGFKLFNDTYGHLAGDACSDWLSKEITARTREGDLVGRYGGDEILVVLPNTDAEGAVAQAEPVAGSRRRTHLDGPRWDRGADLAEYRRGGLPRPRAPSSTSCSRSRTPTCMRSSSTGARVRFGGSLARRSRPRRIRLRHARQPDHRPVRRRISYTRRHSEEVASIGGADGRSSGARRPHPPRHPHRRACSTTWARRVSRQACCCGPAT